MLSQIVSCVLPESSTPVLLPQCFVDVLQKQKDSCWVKDNFKLSTGHKLLLAGKYGVDVAAAAITKLEAANVSAIHFDASWQEHDFILSLGNLSMHSDYLNQTLMEYDLSAKAIKNKEAQQLYDVMRSHGEYLQLKILDHGIKLLSRMIDVLSAGVREDVQLFFVQLWMRLNAMHLTVEARAACNELFMVYHRVLLSAITAKQEQVEKLTVKSNKLEAQFIQAKNALDTATQENVELKKSLAEKMQAFDAYVETRGAESIPVYELENRNQQLLRRIAVLETRLEAAALDDKAAKARIVAIATENETLLAEMSDIKTWQKSLAAREQISTNPEAFFAPPSPEKGGLNSPKRMAQENAYLKLRLKHLQDKLNEYEIQILANESTTTNTNTKPATHSKVARKLFN